MFTLLANDPEGDLYDVRSFGPYTTREEANAAIPDLPDSRLQWRVVESGSVADFLKQYEEEDAEDDAYNALVRQHRGVENVPAPNSVIRNWALQALTSDQEMLTAAEGRGDKRTIKYAKKQVIFWDKIAQKHRPAA
jgi:hypothetical protein